MFSLQSNPYSIYYCIAFILKLLNIFITKRALKRV